MQFRSESFIRHPVEAVFRTYRDRLADVVPYLDDIRAVNVLKREEQGGTVRLHNEWVADREIPKAVSAFLKPDQLKWDDHATWDEATQTCRFDIRTRVFSDAVSVTGHDRFLAVDGGTKVILEGELTIDGGKLPIPGLLARTVVPQIEKFIVTLIPPNLQKVNEAIGRFLDDQPKA